MLVGIEDISRDRYDELTLGTMSKLPVPIQGKGNRSHPSPTKNANPYQRPPEMGETGKATSMMIRTCEAEIEDSWMAKVTVAALSMVASYWSWALLREFLGYSQDGLLCCF